ncbi:dTDP-4-dehydrorhamnose 3,5-epimerase [Candidatus Woesearchaeota archaeon]|nr:dTDP-4-dehydrorhamnose 3,5-epimerase [Candidatus Woesearchaeota archaeon]
MPFSYHKLQIPDVVLIKPRVFPDNRGYFLESYKYSDFSSNGINLHLIQHNHSKSEKGVLRGLHYQKEPKGQGKLIRIVSGSVYDVAVDIRVGSPTYGKWVAEVLDAVNMHMLWIPPGFAHGFLVLENNTNVLYATSNEYSPDHERGIIYNDPSIGVSWPKSNVYLSEKDSELPLLEDCDNNFRYSP